jgi:hypothetical protein
MKYLMILVICLNLYAVELKNFNKLEFMYGSSSGTVLGNDIEAEGHRIILNTYNDIIFNKYVTINSTINYTSRSEIYSRSYNKIRPAENYFEISELDLNIFITPDDIISVGNFSFKNGVFSEHSTAGLKLSDALMTFYYINMTGVFYTHYINENHKIQFGYGARIDDIYQLPEDRYENSRNGSDIGYLFTKSVIDKHTFRINASVSNIIYEKIYDEETLESLGNLYFAGVGYQYDDRDTSGMVYYGIAGVSVTDFDGTEISPTGTALEGPGINFSDEGKRTGYSVLVGAKKDFDANIFRLDSYFGAEYFYASKHWISYATDLENINAYSWGNLGNTFKVYTGIYVTPKIKLGVTGRYEQIDYAKLSGGNSVTPIDDESFRYCIRLDILF